MYKLLLATDKPETLAAFEAITSWEALGFRPPRVVSSAAAALESLARYHADAIAFSLPEEQERMLMDALTADYPLLPILRCSQGDSSAEARVRELAVLLGRTYADYSDDNVGVADMMQLCRHEFFRALIEGRIGTKAAVRRYLDLLRSRMDPDSGAVLLELTLPENDPFFRGRWHYGVDRLEVALRNFFGAELDGMRVLVSVLQDERIFLLCCPMLGESAAPSAEAMMELVLQHTEESIAHVREYLDLELRVASVQVIDGLTALAADEGAAERSDRYGDL